MNLNKSNNLQAKILTFRGVQVMLDRDLAVFYEVKPFRLREQVKRNPNRFPDDFIFQLSDSEVEYLVSQNAIPSKQSLGGNNPFVFTEQNVAALSGVLKNEKASMISIEIFRAFVKMRNSLNQNYSLLNRLVTIELKQTDFEKKLEELLKGLESNNLKRTKGIFFEG